MKSELEISKHKSAKAIDDFVNGFCNLSFVESLFNDLVITDGKGIILHVTAKFKNFWGKNPEKMIGENVYEMEKRKIFYPSITAIVLKTKKKETIIQHNKKGEKHLMTGVPIFDEDGEIKNVVSYSQDINDFVELEKQYQRLQRQLTRYSSELIELRQKDMQFSGIIAKSEKMKNVLRLVLKIAKTDINAIITGETGVGKNLIARLIHKESDRGKGPFIEINCGAIPEALLETELFGYETGAFTGANRKGKVGVIEMANKGTLFLDEIGDLPIGLQVKLLKVIQEKNIVKIGGTRPIKVDFRLVSATNQNIEKMVTEGTFRKDLYYRLNVVPIKISPIRNRQEDIPALISYFLSNLNKAYNKYVALSNATMKMLLSHDWPGNIRELKNIIERIVITGDQNIIGEKNPIHVLDHAQSFFKNVTSLTEAKERMEEHMVKTAYSKTRTSVGVGKYLGISQTSASRKIRKYIKNENGSSD